MSAIVCGKRSSIFEDIPSSPVSKRVRCSSSSPVRFSPPRSSSSQFSFSSSSYSSFLDHLIALFPDMDKQLLENALQECGDDLDLTIKSLNELRLGCIDNSLSTGSAGSHISPEAISQPSVAVDQDTAPGEDPSSSRHLPKDGPEWVELIVSEMTSASNLDDARNRAARALEALEKSILGRANAEAAQNIKENTMMKEQLQMLLQENSILKRAVSIQNERQKEFDEKGQELQQLKQLVAQYQEQLRTLEINNYALAMHLKQAQQSNSMPGRFHPDVF